MVQGFQFLGPKSNSIGFREVSRGYNTGRGACLYYNFIGRAAFTRNSTQVSLAIIFNKYPADRNSMRHLFGTQYDNRSHAGHSDSAPLTSSMEGFKSKRRTQAAAKMLETAADLSSTPFALETGRFQVYDPVYL